MKSIYSMNSFFTSSDTFNIMSKIKRCVFFNAYNGKMKVLIMKLLG